VILPDAKAFYQHRPAGATCISAVRNEISFTE